MSARGVHWPSVGLTAAGRGAASGGRAGSTGGSGGAWDLRLAPSSRPARACDSPPSRARVPSAGPEVETLGGSHGVTPGSPQAEPV